MGAYVSLLGWVSNRRGVLAGTTAQVVCVGVVAALLVTANGYPTEKVDLNDSGVWTVNQDAGRVARVIAAINDTGLPVESQLTQRGQKFDLLQDGRNVVVWNVTSSKAAVLDPASGLLSADVALPADSQVAVGGSLTVVVDRANGRAWFGPSASVLASDFSTPGTASIPTGADAVAAIGPDGTLAIASPSTSEVTLYRWSGDAVVSGPSSPIPSGKVQAVTTVGGGSQFGDVQPVVEMADARVVLPGGDVAALPSTSGAVLQLPGPTSDSVLVATEKELFSVPLDGGAVSTHFSDGTGRPARPVVVGDYCIAAWSDSPLVAQGTCGDDRFPATPALNGKKAGATLVLRVNHGFVVLNDPSNGDTAVTTDVAHVLTWHEPAQSTTKKKDQPGSEQAALKLDAPVSPIRTKPDVFGVRPGASALLRVLANDENTNKLVLRVDGTAVSSVAPAAAGSVTTIDGGKALQIVADSSAAGSANFTYVATDGRAKSGATGVQVKIITGNSNQEPKLLEGPPVPSLKVPVRGSASFALLDNWFDPEGDQMTLECVGEPSGVRCSPDGTITVRGSADLPQNFTLKYSVRDDHVGVGRGPSGSLQVKIVGIDGDSPIARPDYAVAVLGQPITLTPIVNDTGFGTGALNLSLARAVPGMHDNGDGTLTFTPTQPGTVICYYRVASASRPSSTALGVIRIDVVKADPNADPVASPDNAGLHSQGSVIVDVLANDFDPSGHLLMVTSVREKRRGSATDSVAAQVLDGRLLRISALPGFLDSADLTYTVSNGTKTASSTVSVRAIADSVGYAAPLTQDDSVTVQAGAAVNLPVLSNDADPEGGSLTLEPLPPTAIGFRTPQMSSDKLALRSDGSWTAFTNGDVITLVAPGTPGVVLMTYSVLNQHGDSASASVKVVVTEASKDNTPSQPPPLQARLFTGQAVTIPAAANLDHGGFPVQLADPTDQPTPSGLGSVQLTSDGYLFTAGATAGIATFPYRVRTASGVFGPPSLVTVVIAEAVTASEPVAVPDVVRARPNRSVDVDVTANDFTPSGQTVKLVDVGPRDGFRTVDGNVRVTVGAGTTPLSSPYTIEAQGRQAVGSLNVTPDATAPLLPLIAASDSAPPGVDTTVTVPVLKNDLNPNGTSSDLKLESAAPTAVIMSTNATSVVVRRGKFDQYAWYTISSKIDKQPEVQGLIFIPGIAQKPEPINPPPPLTVKEGGPAVTLDITKYAKSLGGLPLRLVNVKQPAATGVTATPVDSQHLKLVALPSGVGLVPILVTDLPEGTQVPDSLVATINVPVTVERNPPDPLMLPTAVSVTNDGTPAPPIGLAPLLSPPDSKAQLSFRDAKAPSGIVARLTGSSLVVSSAVGQAPGRYRVSYTVVRVGAVHPGVGVIDVTVTKLLPPALQPCPAMSFQEGQPVTLDLAQCIAPTYRDVAKLSFTAKSSDGSVSGPNGSKVTFTRLTSFKGGETSLSFTASDTVNVVSGQWHFTVYGPPDPPTNVFAKAVYETAGAATVTWSEPLNKGGVATLAYVVEATPVGGGSVVSTANNNPASADVVGLDPVKKYTFVVLATSAQAPKPSPSSSGGPFGPFDRTPTVESVKATTTIGGSAAVSWTVTQLGSPLKSVTITALPKNPSSGAGVPCAAPPLVVPNAPFAGSSSISLVLGCSYTFQVDAANQNDLKGQGLSNAVEPFDTVSEVPTPTAQLSSSVLGKTIDVTWTPADVYTAAHGILDSGSGIQVSVSGAASKTVTVTGNPGFVSVDVPLYGDYKVWLIVTNTGRQSAIGGFATRKAAGTPDKPVVTGGGPLDTAATVTYSLGAAYGLAWQSVVVTASNGATAPGSFPPGGGSGSGVATFSTGSLANGTPYSFTVKACNELTCATSDPDPQPPVVPYGAPTAPTVALVTAAGNSTVTVQLRSASGNGRSAAMSLSISGPVTGNGCPTSWTLAANSPLNTDCSFTGSVGGSFTVTVSLVQATSGATRSGSGSGTIANPPPPPPPSAVSVSWGARAAAKNCNGDTSCTFVTISWANFSAGNHTITPHLDGQGNWCGTLCSNSLVRSGSSGTLTGYWSAGYCTVNHYVTADVDGMLSANSINTNDHPC